MSEVDAALILLVFLSATLLRTCDRYLSVFVVLDVVARINPEMNWLGAVTNTLLHTTPHSVCCCINADMQCEHHYSCW
jgi:hypothetical protein